MSNDVIKMKFNSITRVTATWCGPCKQYAPIFEEVTNGFIDDWKIITLDLDTDKGKAFAEKHGVRGVPATIIERSGEEPIMLSGVRQANELKELLK